MRIEINGIPKEDYWIQMQIQIEVCNLSECDFEKTKFTEYCPILNLQGCKHLGEH